MYKFESLTIWKESIDYLERTYQVIKKLPKEEQYNISDQLRRAVTSVCLNIAEGTGSRTDKEFIGFLSVSKKSLTEVVAILKIVQRLYNITVDEEEIVAEKLMKQIASLIRYLSKQ